MGTSDGALRGLDAAVGSGSVMLEADNALIGSANSDYVSSSWISDNLSSSWCVVVVPAQFASFQLWVDNFFSFSFCSLLCMGRLQRLGCLRVFRSRSGSLVLVLKKKVGGFGDGGIYRCHRRIQPPPHVRRDLSKEIFLRRVNVALVSVNLRHDRVVQ